MSLGAEIARRAAALPTLADPVDAGEYLAILRALYAAGRAELPLGRLFEGHVDAGQIARRYGGGVPAGATLGVWNAGLAGEPLRLADGRLSGGKAFASGAGVLSHALVTADAPGGVQLLLLDLAAAPPAIDRSVWRVTGMQRSQSHVVRWDDVAIPDAWRVGAPGDYVREPWFSGGALRFVSVQAGGVAGLFDRARDHLVATGRAGDPFQAARLAELFSLADGLAGSIRLAAERWFADAEEARQARVAALRAAVIAAGERALALAQAAVGLQGMFVDHPLAAHAADLAVYLRQPAPDAQRLRAGAAAAAGLLAPAL